jgi:hypothetical protein
MELEKYLGYRKGDLIDYTSSDIADYHHDFSLLDDFPLPSVEGEPGKHLKYKPWEEHIKSMEEAAIPLAIPDEWDPDKVVDKEGGSTYREYWSQFPFAK